MKKERIDVLLVKLKLVPSRENAKALIMAGKVLCGTQKILKPSEMYKETDDIIVKSKLHNYVSRGGLKLEKAIKIWKLNFENKVVLDVGSSTGGFTDCALQNKAKKVYALDVGTNQLDYKLRKNSKVISYENTNFRNIEDDFFKEKMDIIVMDVSFISIKVLIENVYKNLKENGEIIFLIKPQFETIDRTKLEKGIIKDSAEHKKIINDVVKSIKNNGFKIIDISESPIKGQKGNKEFLVYGIKKVI